MRYFLLLCGALFLTGCTHSVYQTAGIEAIAEKHSTIAVLQPKVEYLFAKPENKNWARVPAMDTIAAGFQLALTNWIRAEEQGGRLDITVLDVETTNKLLADVSSTDYALMARKLGVDAVMVSRLKYDTRHEHSPHIYSFQGGLASRVYLNLFTPGEGLIWSYENVGHRRFASYDRLVRELLLPAAMNLPYEVAK